MSPDNMSPAKMAPGKQPATIKNPIEWGGSAIAGTGRALGSIFFAPAPDSGAAPARVRRIRKIGFDDLTAALAAGYQDFAAYRTDVIFLCFVYAVAGVVIARTVFGQGLLPMLFPLASGFAILGPMFGVGLYEMSKRREQGAEVSWMNAFGVFGEPGFPSIAALGLILIVLFLMWLATAFGIYQLTLGPDMPASPADFLRALGTPAGAALIMVGCGAGAVFAIAALCIGLISFPLLLDDGRASLGEAVRLSFAAVLANPIAAAAWGGIVAGSLILGTLPLFLGLVVALPVLGHATWHLYRRLIAVS